MNVTIVTCTGLRPELFSLCRKWVDHQTHRATRWIVATDVDERPDIPEWAEHFNFHEQVTQVSTFCSSNRSLHLALREVDPNSATAIFEDDDYYVPDYIERALALIENGSEIVGDTIDYRYHAPARKWCQVRKRIPNAGALVLGPGLASWFASWLTKSEDGVPAFQKKAFGIGRPRFSIKGAGYGLPGRPGGMSDLDSKKWRPDPHGHVLEHWIGREHAHDYLSLVQP